MIPEPKALPTVPCPACNAVVDAQRPGANRIVRCEHCGIRFPLPREGGGPKDQHWERDDPDGLGIHPALARRHQERSESMVAEAGTIKISPSLVSEGAGPTEASIIGKTRALGPRAMAQQKRRDHKPETQEPVKEEQKLPVIPGFQLKRVVGKGAMGRVYEAIDERSNRRVALKELAPELAVRQDFIARFEREVAALKAVDHPGVVRILGAGEYKNQHFFIMDFVEGTSLRHLLAEGPLQPLRAVKCARQFVQALGAAHSKKVVHRDLKPENILIHGDIDNEHLVLVDFGLADMGEDDPHPNLTKSRMTMGTVNYMAPEQRVDAKRVTAQADLYAAGVIFYELLTGDLPLGRFKLPTERASLSHLPSLIDDIIVRALDRDADKRFAHADDFDAQLTRVQKQIEKQISQDTVVGRVGHRDDDTDIDNPTLPESPFPPEDDAQGPFEEGFLGKGEAAVADVLSDDDLRLLSESPSDLPLDEPGLSKRPRWVTSPPWVRRPEILWILAALVGGAIFGFLSSRNRADDGNGESLVWNADMQAVSEGSEWRAWSPGWKTTEDGSITWAGIDPDTGRVSARLALVVHRDLRTESERAVAGRLARAGTAMAGVFVVRPQRAIGAVDMGGGQCAIVEATPTSPEPVAKTVFPCPENAAQLIELDCTKGTSCDVAVDGKVIPEARFETGDGRWFVGYGCSGGSCAVSPVGS